MYSFLLTLGFGSLLDVSDDSDSHSHLHVADGEAAEGREVLEGLANHVLGGGHLDEGGLAGLDALELVVAFVEDLLAGSLVGLLNELGEFASDVAGVAVDDGGVALVDLECSALAALAGHDDLRVEALGLHDFLFVVLTHDVAALEFLDGQVLDVESDVHAGDSLLELLVVHLDGLELGADVVRCEPDLLLGLEDAGLDAAHRDRADAADLVHVLEGHAQGLVGGSLGALHAVEHVGEGRALVPRHVRGDGVEVVAVESGDGYELDVLRLEAGLLGEAGELGLDLALALLVLAARVHLVDADDHLADAQGLSEQSVLAGLALGGEGSLEAADVGGQDHEGDVSL
mmetsp:Transcript_71797/g.155035  ORF Transcript_71797/g.155035 Transcript_71797/m.155035 type:complete len:344 (-) Transcript_71797:469-1500(-)